MILRQHPGAYAREYARRTQEAVAEEKRLAEWESTPVERMQYGRASDALPIDELDDWLGWSQPQEV